MVAAVMRTRQPASMLDARSLGMGLFASGTLILAAPAAPEGCSDPVCGNGTVEFPEACDGNVGNLTCQDDYRYVDGPLKCSESCQFDYSECNSAVCGDGVVERTEACDGSNLNGRRFCKDLDPQWAVGELSCRPSNCQYNTTDCRESVCGNGSIEGPELCDGNNLGGRTCENTFFGTSILGVATNYMSGTLKCSESCYLDASGCQPWPGCYVNVYSRVVVPFCI